MKFFNFNNIMKKFVKKFEYILVNFCKEYWNLRELMYAGEDTLEQGRSQRGARGGPGPPW